MRHHCHIKGGWTGKIACQVTRVYLQGKIDISVFYFICQLVNSQGMFPFVKSIPEISILMSSKCAK